MEDHTAPKKSPNPSALIVGISLFLLIGGAAYFYVTSRNTITHSVTLSQPPLPEASVPSSGTFIKIEVSPAKHFNPDSNISDETMRRARSLRKLLSNLPFPVSVNADVSANVIKVNIGSTEDADIEKIKELITRSGKLTIHAVHRQSRILADKVATKEEVIPGYTALPHSDKDFDTGKITTEYVLIRSRAEVTQDDIKAAYVDPRDFTIINIELTDAGGDKMTNFTLTLTQRLDMIATVYDGRVLNYATLNAESLGKRFVITGLDSEEEAQALTQSLQRKQSKLKITQERSYKDK